MSAHVEPKLGDRPTERELEVLYWRAQGLTNARTAKRLKVSEDSAKSHLRRLFVKLGVNSAPHAVAQAYERRLVPFTVRGVGE